MQSSGPIVWEGASNVLWKTPLPGLGHSSPIVLDQAAYFTTAYPSSSHARVRIAVQVGLYLATVAILLVGGALLVRELCGPGTPGIRRLPRVLAQAGLAAGLGLAIFYIPRRFGLEENDNRAWKMSAVVGLLALALAALQVPSSSRARLFLALVAPGLCGGLYAAFPDRRELFALGSVGNLVNLGLLGSPLLAGIFFVVAHLRSRSRNSGAAPPALGLAKGCVVVVCLAVGVGFFVQYEYLRTLKQLVRAVICLDLATGRIRWVCEGLPGVQANAYQMNSPATPTPVTDGQQIYAYFGSAGLMCVSREGRLRWSNRELPAETRFGNATSPVLLGQRVVVVSDIADPRPGDRQPHSYLAALDPDSGRIVWQHQRKNHDTFASYATPLLDIRPGATNLLWVRGWHDVKAYEPVGGREIGSLDLKYKGNHLVASPVSDGQRLYLLDAASLVCLDINKILAGQDAVIWTKKSRGEVAATPLLLNGLLFTVAEDGQVECLEAASGRACWQKRLRGRFFASPIGVGNGVCFVSESGQVSLVAAEREFKLLTEYSLGEKTYATPVPVGQKLLVRTVSHLYCIQ